jgi:hypothetical protein
MTKNMGTVDKAIRIAIAIIIGVLYYMGKIEGTTAIIALALALVFVLTSFLNFCPLYVPFGINTCKK